jgi:hypothetical protein
MNLTKERLHSAFDYNQESGLFTRKITLSSRAKLGDVVGVRLLSKYLSVMIDGNHYQLSRLAWFYVHGVWPKNHIDHRNGDTHDNRILNLREATMSENKQNLSGKSGSLGTTWCSHSNKWKAQIKVNGKTIYLGIFKTREAAYSAYCASKMKIHNFQPTPRE